MPMHANGRRNRKQHRFISVAYTQTDPPGGSIADRGRSLLSTIALFAIVTYVVCYFVVFVGHDRETCEKRIKPIEVPFGPWTLVGPRNHMGSWTHPRGYKSPTKKGHFCRRHSSACPDMPAADILDILDVIRRNQQRCGQSQPLLQQPGARFTKYLTIYRKIIVSLS